MPKTATEINCSIKLLTLPHYLWAGKLNRHSDWLRAGGEIFRTCPDRPWGPPSLLYNGYQVFPGGRKRPGRDIDPSPPSSAEV
jgi:hypothetical protein